MSDTPDPHADIPPPQRRLGRRGWHLSPVWLVPLIAGLVGISMLVHTWLSAGPKVTISFQSAVGLEAGKTAVKYKNVVVGHVQGLRLSPDHARVLVTVALNKEAEDLARSDTRFWVVRPRIGVGGISGVETVLSGAFIEVDSGDKGEATSNFTGLESPPTVLRGSPGRAFVLHAEDIGSLDIGSPVYYRRIPVGQVASYQLDADGKGVTLQVFVYAPHDKLVNQATRFWNASGLDVSLSTDGFKFNAQSVATVLAGGVAFSTPTEHAAPPANDHTRFVLARDERTAVARLDGPPLDLRMRFDQSLHGLAPDAVVEFMGINVGNVTGVRVDYDPDKQRFPVVVDVRVYPSRLGAAHDKVVARHGDSPAQTAQFMAGMVARGLRAQVRPGNLLSGQLYVAMDFIPNAPKADFDLKAQPLVLPTVRSSLEQLQSQLASIAGKIDRIPFDALGQHLDGDLQELDKTLKQLNGQVLPQASQTLQEAQRTFRTANGALGEDAPLQQNLGQTLQELQRSARSLRTLTDMLGRHPEALIRGRPNEPAPPPDMPPKAPALVPSEGAK